MPDYGCHSAITNLEGRTYTMRDTAGCFIILAVGLAISLAVLVTEIIIHRIQVGGLVWDLRRCCRFGRKGVVDEAEANRRGLAGAERLVWYSSWVKNVR